MYWQIYNSNPQIYLDLGGALAAFGLIFAVYQLRKPEWELVLRIRNNWERNLFWILGGAGLLITLVRVLIPEFHAHCWWFPFNNTLFYEITAYLLFILSPLSLIYFSTKTSGLFNEKTARKFYTVMARGITKSNDDNLNASLKILFSNLTEICKAARGGEAKEMTQSARAILDVILSDESVVKILTTKRLDGLQMLFSAVEKNSISRKEAGVGVPRIVRNLFYDKESFLYKHLERGGLSIAWNIYDSIFNSPTILTNFNLFGWPTFSFSVGKDFNITEIEVFIEALSRAIKTYLKTGNVPPAHINDGLSHLSDVFGSICSKISEQEKRGVDTKYSLRDEWWGLHLIAHFLGHGYTFLAYQDQLNSIIKEKEKNVLKPDFHSNQTINAGIAATIYKGFEQLSYIENTTDTYHTVLDLLYGMMHEYELKEGYREPFEKAMWEQIAANVKGKYYPAPLRTYLEFIGFCLVTDRDNGWIGQQTERMRRLLYIDLKPKLDANEKMVNKQLMKDVLLPKLMDYKNDKFTYKFEFGEGEEKEIEPPLNGSKSALEGIDLNHRNFDIH